MGNISLLRAIWVVTLASMATVLSPTEGAEGGPNAQSSISLADLIPFEDLGACPLEGCVYDEWIANSSVELRSKRETTAPIIGSLAQGEKATALTGVVVTLEAGQVQFREPQDLTSNDGTIHILPGQTLRLLTYEGEGYTKAWFNGKVYRSVDTLSFYNAVCDVEPSRCAGWIAKRSETEWWVQIRNAAGEVG